MRSLTAPRPLRVPRSFLSEHDQPPEPHISETATSNTLFDARQVARPSTESTPGRTRVGVWCTLWCTLPPPPALLLTHSRSFLLPGKSIYSWCFREQLSIHASTFEDQFSTLEESVSFISLAGEELLHDFGGKVFIIPCHNFQEKFGWHIPLHEQTWRSMLMWPRERIWRQLWIPPEKKRSYSVKATAEYMASNWK